MRSDSSKQKQIAAFSLAELLIALSLMGLLLTGVYALLTLSTRSAREAEVFETVHSQALVGVAKIRQELTLTSMVSVSDLTSGPDSIVFASPQLALSGGEPQVYTYGPNGNLEWHKWVAFYRDGSQIVRAEIPFASPTNFPPDTPPPLSDFQALASNQKLPIARNCASLKFEPGTGINGSVLVTLQTIALVNSDQATELTLRDEIAPRNEP